MTKGDPRRITNEPLRRYWVPAEPERKVVRRPVEPEPARKPARPAREPVPAKPGR